MSPNRHVARLPSSDYELTVRRHAEHYADRLQLDSPMVLGDPDGRGCGQVQALARLRLELWNLQEALDSALNRGLDALLPFAEHLPAALELANEYQLLEAFCERLLTAATELDSPTLRLPAMTGLALAQRQLGRSVESEAAAVAAAALALELKQPVRRAAALRILGQCLAARGSAAEAQAALDEAQELAREAGAEHVLGTALNQLGILYFEQGRYDEARKQLEQAALLQQRLGSLVSETRSLSNLGMLEVRAGRLDKAEDLFEQALALHLLLDDRRGEAICLTNLGSIALDRKHYPQARAHYSRGLATARDSGQLQVQAALLSNLGMVAREEGDYMLAATLLNDALEMHIDIGQRIGEGVTLMFMAIVSLLLHNPRQAAQYLVAAMKVIQECEARRELAICAGLAGTLLAGQGDLSRAAILIEAALYQEQFNGYRFEDDVKAILASGEAQYNGALPGISLSLPELGRAREIGMELEFDELALLAARTLEERFLQEARDAESPDSVFAELAFG